MKETISIINKIKNTSSTNEKIAILKDNKDNELLKRILYYTYNPDLKYKITEDVITPYIIEFSEYDKDPFKLLDKLATSNINDELRREVGMFLGSLTQEEGEFWLNVLQKDLRCNISVKTIQKVWKGLIPEWGCMLGSKYFDNEKYVEGKSFTLTVKLDGHRCLIVKHGNDIKAYTRQHKEYLGLDDIINEVSTMEGDFVLDGELLVSNYKEIPPETRYKATSNIVRKDGIKHGVSLIAFDIVPHQDFIKGKCNAPYIERRKRLEQVLSNKQFIEVVDIVYKGSDTDVIIPLLEEVTSKGEEGLMLNLNNHPYECKRTKGLLKLKKFQTADVRVVEVLEGDGKYKDKLGAITIEFEHNGEVHRCNVGSGFSDNERLLYHRQPELLLNKIVEIGYFEITSNAKGGVGLRFPTWKSRIRHDKTGISMN